MKHLGTFAKDESLNTIYSALLEGIETQPRMKLIFSWIFRAERPLTLSELQQAIALSDHQSSLAGARYPESSEILRWCRGLVILDSTATVQFIHLSVQEFFLVNIKMLVSELSLARSCLHFLSLADFETGECTDLLQLRIRLKDAPFLNYAARYWTHHLKACENSTLDSPTISLLTSVPHLRCAAQIGNYSDRTIARHATSETRYTSGLQISGLHVASLFGLEPMIPKLLETGIDIEVADHRSQTPLICAAKSGHTSLVEYFINKNANIESKDSTRHRTALGWATFCGHEDVVKKLLTQCPNINLNSFDYQHSTPLHIAFEKHYYGIVDLLITGGASLNIVDKWQRTPAELAFKGSSLVDTATYQKDRSRAKKIAQGGQARVTVFKRTGFDHSSLIC